MLLATLIALMAASATPPIGVAVPTAGALFLAIDAPSLAPGATVTLVDPQTPQSARPAAIQERVSFCGPCSKANLPAPYYRLQLSSPPDTPSSYHPAIAFVGDVPSTKSAPDSLTLNLSPEHPRVQVRSCTSTEGLHLTVWTGAPLESERLWHQYFYLGYDVEPSCENGDLANPSA